MGLTLYSLDEWINCDVAPVLYNAKIHPTLTGWNKTAEGLVNAGIVDGLDNGATPYPPPTPPPSLPSPPQLAERRPDVVSFEGWNHGSRPGGGSYMISTGSGQWKFTSLQGMDPDATMQLADMNGDGRSDLVVYEAGSSSFRVGYGTASGDFANWSVWKSGIGRPTSWDVADVTGS
jgi:hypothetical protein